MISGARFGTKAVVQQASSSIYPISFVISGTLMLVKVPGNVNQFTVVCNKQSYIRGLTVGPSPAIRYRWTVKPMLSNRIEPMTKVSQFVGSLTRARGTFRELPHSAKKS